MKSKKNLILTMLICFCLGMVVNVQAKNNLSILKGTWMGQMQIPNGPKLRVGLEVFKKADGNWGANVASMDQGNRYINVSEIFIENNLLTIQLQGAPITIVGTIDKDVQQIDAEFKQGDHGFPLILTPVKELEDIQRKQTPKINDGYSINEVSYQNMSDNVWLSGTLTLPKGNDKKPAVMMIAGSGPSHRDAYHSGHRPFMVLADYLTKNGFVVLRSDKRGVYKSTGKFTEGDVENFANDTKAAVQFLKNHPRVNPDQVYLIGHSEGSMVAAMASLIEPVNGIISLAGPGMSTLDILLLQDQTEPRAKGASEDDIKVLLEFSQKFYQVVLDEKNEEQRKQKLQKLYDTLSKKELEIHKKWNQRIGTLNVNTASNESFREFLKQNPLKSWAKVTAPVFVINGGKDAQVPATENVEGIMMALKSTNSQIESKIFPKLNHVLQTAETGSTDEYAQIEETIAPDVLKTILEWLLKH